MIAPMVKIGKLYTVYAYGHHTICVVMDVQRRHTFDSLSFELDRTRLTILSLCGNKASKFISDGEPGK